jgi:exopolysaccharide biosynthesis polyprenyl glycosylphosphotransferase
MIGTGRVAQRIAEKLAARPEYGLQVVGFLDNQPLELPDDAPPYLGELERLELLVHAHRIERVIVAFSQHPAEAHVELLRRCSELGVRVDIVPRLFEVIGSRSVFHEVCGVPLVSVKAPRLSRPARLLKRTMDLAIAGVALVILGPFFAFAAWRIKRESPGPVFFRQERMGAGGKTFRIFKFRSMHADADERKHEVGHLNIHRESGPRMFKVPNDPRITRFGRFLRKWSLDELPQLINVVRGEMSLVGPRPLILGEDENIHGHQRRRLGITPGVTGLWQVLGRSDIPFSEMVTLDYIYVTNWSLWGDFKLLVRTVPVVVRGNGAY